MDIQAGLVNDQSNMVVLRELTNKLHQTEQANKEYQQRLITAAQEWRETFDSIQDAIFIQDDSFTITRVNRKFASFFGCHPKDLVGRKCYEVACINVDGYNADGTRPADNCPFEIVRADGDPTKWVRREVFAPKFGGWVEVSIAPLKNGEVHGAIHVMRDINERKANELKLQETSDVLKLLCDYSRDYLWVKDANNRFQYASKGQLENVLRMPLEAIIGKTDTEVAQLRREQSGVVHEFGEICNATDDITKASKKPCHFIEIGYTGGAEIYLDVHKSPILNSNDEVIGTVGCASNATQFKDHVDAKLKELLEQGKAKHLFNKTYQILTDTAHG